MDYNIKKIFVLFIFLTVSILSCGDRTVEFYSPDFGKEQIKTIVFFPLLVMQKDKMYAPRWIKTYADNEIIEDEICSLAEKTLVDWFQEKFADYKIIQPSTLNFELEGLSIPTYGDALSYVVNHYEADAIFVFKISNYVEEKVKQTEEYVGGFVYQQRDQDRLSGKIEFTMIDNNISTIWKLTTNLECEGRFPMPMQNFINEFLKEYEVQLNNLSERIKS